MRRIRPTRVLTAAATGLAVLGVLTWTTDPAWARSAGLDVWNVGQLEEELRKCQAERARLEAEEAVTAYQAARNQVLVGEVAAGRRPLTAAAADLWRENKDRPAYASNLSYYFRGPTMEARAAHHILQRVEFDGVLRSAERAAALARLRAEYASAYGVPAPEGR